MLINFVQGGNSQVPSTINPSVRAALRACFKMKLDWVISGEAENGEAALELARDTNPDVILLDYAMPVMNGLEATRQLSAQNPEYPTDVHHVCCSGIT
jgi:DNA-binding NarL/FixJ family response regulator